VIADDVSVEMVEEEQKLQSPGFKSAYPEEQESMVSLPLDQENNE